MLDRIDGWVLRACMVEPVEMPADFLHETDGLPVFRDFPADAQDQLTGQSAQWPEAVRARIEIERGRR